MLPAGARRAHVINGRIVVDEPVDLPDGAEVGVFLGDEDVVELSSAQRHEIDSALAISIAQADAGLRIDADEVLADLERD